MNISHGDLVTWLMVGWLAGMGNVWGQDKATEPRPDVTEPVPGQTLMCRPGAAAGALQLFRQQAGGSMDTEAAYTLKPIPELGEVEVYLPVSDDTPRYHIMAMPDKSIRVFLNDAGRRRQYPSYTMEPEAGKPGSYAVYQSRATVIERAQSALIEIDNAKAVTRIYRTLDGDEKRHGTTTQILHTDLAAVKGFRIKGLDLKTLTGVVGAIDLLH